jgi:hypothetical protein
MLKTILLMTRGIILDPRGRRWTMFILIVAALLMVFAGSTFLSSIIVTPWSFIVYWGVCAWLTLAAMLLAVWDIIMVRVAARRQRRELEKQIADRKSHDHPHDHA